MSPPGMHLATMAARAAGSGPPSPRSGVAGRPHSGSQRTRPRDVYCAVEHLHRSEALAREVSAGRFTHCGVTLEVPTPEWTNVAVHPDREWWIDWSKFGYGLDLAYAFSRTGEATFADTWQRLVASWIDQVPIGFGPTDAMGRRLQHWIYAWNIFSRTPSFQGFGAEFELKTIANIEAQAGYLRAHLTAERNHRTLELYALLIVALALPGTDPGGGVTREVWQALHDNLLADFRPDGVHREHSTHYHMVALRSFLAARENARRFAIEVEPIYDERLSRAVEFALFCQRPDGTIPALSDADVADYRESLALAADLLGRPDVRYAATNGAHGLAPERQAADFPDAGYYIVRSSWAGDSRHRHQIFDCGPLGDGGHGHYDLLSVDLWADRPILVDPGRYTYAEGEPNWRRWFKGTAAHNTVVVDGRDQTAYHPGKPRTAPAAGRLLTRLDSALLDVVGGEAISPEYDAVHRRHVFFVAGDYWIVLDELEAPTAHEHDLRFHLVAPAWQQTAIEGNRVVAPSVEIVVVGPGTVAIEDGWVAPQYGV